MRDRKVVKKGKIFTQELNDGRPYQVTKQKSTASTLCSFPVHQQGRAIAFSPHHQHIAVSNNYGDISIFDYNDFSKKITMITTP